MKLNDNDNEINPMIVSIYAPIIVGFLPYLFSVIPINRVFIKPEAI